MSVSRLIDIAQGKIPADLVVRNARIFHLTDGTFEQADIAIADGKIAGIGSRYEGTEILDAMGLTAVPGFIDAHFHMESCMVTPREYCRSVLPLGVTTAFCDPHELANVFGTEAFRYILQAASQLPMDLQVRFSSCVPATSLETSGAEITAADLEEWKLRYPQAGLGEMMNIPGVLEKAPDVLRKISLFDEMDGHCPLLTGPQLCAYITAGARNCHESTNLPEAMEKLHRGMQILIREGTVAKDLDTLSPLLTTENSPFCSFCTDDLNIRDMEQQGHIGSMIARCIAKGISPLAAYRAASWSTANAMRLRDRGLIAPGRRADIILLKNLEKCEISRVLVQGKIVCPELLDSIPHTDDTALRHSVKLREITAADFPFTHQQNADVIGIRPGRLLTDHLHLPTDSRDVLRAAVLERHGKNGNIGLGWVKGFGLQCGAFASSVEHDSHNICVIGTNPEDMALAVNTLRETQGGMVVAVRGKITGLLPLPLGGLMSVASRDEVLRQLRQLSQAVRETGCLLEAGIQQLTFLALPVIPYLKLTDRGLVDVEKSSLLP